MSRNYKFHNPKGLYFVSFAVVHWIKVFTETSYCEILLESLEYSQKEKSMEIFAWCIMSNHVHLIFRSTTDYKPQDLLGDFKRFTSKKIVTAIMNNPDEDRKGWMLKQFYESGQKTSNVKDFQFWRHDNHPIELGYNAIIDQKVNYIHNNPVKAGIVENAEDYPYSSARDYAGEKGLLSVTLVG